MHRSEAAPEAEKEALEKGLERKQVPRMETEGKSVFLEWVARAAGKTCTGARLGKSYILRFSQTRFSFQRREHGKKKV